MLPLYQKTLVAFIFSAISSASSAGWDGQTDPAKESFPQQLNGAMVKTNKGVDAKSQNDVQQSKSADLKKDASASITSDMSKSLKMEDVRATKAKQLMEKRVAQTQASVTAELSKEMSSVLKPFPYGELNPSEPGMTYEEAIKRIVPIDWNYSVPAYLAKLPAEWGKGETQETVLNKLVKGYGGSIQLNVDDKTITHYIYGIKKREGLRDALSRWAEISGWVVNYQLSGIDFRSVSQSWFGDDFKESVILLEKSFKSRGSLLDVEFITTEPGNTSDKVLTIKRTY